MHRTLAQRIRSAVGLGPVLAASAASAVLLLAGAAHSELRKWNPPSLFESRDFNQVAVARGMRRTIFIAGQGPIRPGKPLTAGVSLAEQTRRTLANVRDALTAVGATPDDVVAIHNYVSKVHFMSGITVGREVRRFFNDRMPVSTFIPVQQLIWPHAQVQLDVIVELPQ